jgi:uncharacterized protein (DUF1684 family)
MGKGLIRSRRAASLRGGWRSRLAFVLGISLSWCAAAGSEPSPPGIPADYEAAIQEWRAARETGLLSETGWLTIAGLYWLEPGANLFGSDELNAIVLPGDAAPGRAGSLILQAAGDTAQVRLEVAPGVDLLCNGAPARGRILHSDKHGEADILKLGRVEFWIIQRGDRWGVRLRDPESPIRRDFRGLQFFAVDPGYRVAARFVPYSETRSIAVPNILGHVDSSEVSGELVFDLRGTPCRLIPLAELPADSSLFIIFSDGTTGGKTYGGGRFLSSRLRADGTAILDFNKAYNPPCAFNPYTTCPLPPAQNRLELPIRAGEMMPPESH